MLSLRLTALSCTAAFLAGVFATLFVWNYIERGRTIEDQRRAMASKDRVIDLVSDRSKNEEGITNAKDARIKKLDGAVADKRQPMSPAVRLAIDSLYR